VDVPEKLTYSVASLRGIPSNVATIASASGIVAVEPSRRGKFSAVKLNVGGVGEGDGSGVGVGDGVGDGIIDGSVVGDGDGTVSDDVLHATADRARAVISRNSSTFFMFLLLLIIIQI
jgi:hypothetical protein